MTRKELEELWERDPREAIKLEIEMAIRQHEDKVKSSIRVAKVQQVINEAEQIVKEEK